MVFPNLSWLRNQNDLSNTTSPDYHACNLDSTRDIFHCLSQYFCLAEILQYGGYPEMAQKVIEGDFVTWRHMHEILRWPKIRKINFFFYFDSKYKSFVNCPKFEEKWNLRRILSEFWVMSEFSEENNWAILGFWQVINISIRNKREN